MQLTVAEENARSDWLEQFDPRMRLMTALLFALTTVALQQISLLILILFAALLAAWVTGISRSVLLTRLLAMEGFMLVLLIMLPFSIQGESLFTLGALSASIEGIERAIQIVLKANAIVIMLMTMIGTLEPVVLGHALAQLKLPEKLIHLFLFTVRYISVLFDEYQRLRMAMRARAFIASSNRHTWRSFGWLIGMLLVRSLERSQRILAAMKCRGFNGKLYLITTNCWQMRDTLVLLTLSLLCLFALLLDQTL